MDPLMWWGTALIVVVLVFRAVARWADKLEREEREQLTQQIRGELLQEMQQQYQQFNPPR